MMLSLLTMMPGGGPGGPITPQASDEVHYIPFEGGYKCKHCNYCAPHRNLVVRHARTHTGERPYACNYCSYRSSRLDNMRTHSYKCAEKRQKRNLGVMKGLNNNNTINLNNALTSGSGGGLGGGGGSQSGGSNPTLSGLLSTPVLTVQVHSNRGQRGGDVQLDAHHQLDQQQQQQQLEYEQPSLSILPLPQDLTDAVLPTLEGLYED
ncbi:sal protein 3-like [Tropilaelaps mercedesae]|uniref:Sal protein 3-like n=1 Tax=Tropilaelaps mercedesae TaxID=418985 RepID=A0A1V9XN07_9ACAR|nr:sal protein 3-like [Tropilaelaps mercedesae]